MTKNITARPPWSLLINIGVRRTSIDQCSQSSHYHNIYVSMKLTVHVRERVSVFARFSGRVAPLLSAFSPFNGKLRSEWYRSSKTHCNYHFQYPISKFTLVFVRTHLPHAECAHTLTLIIII